jgi:hypothetical protein
MRAFVPDLNTGFDKPLRQPIKRVTYDRGSWQKRVGVNDEYSEALKVSVARRRQFQPIRHTTTLLIRAGDYVER